MTVMLGLCLKSATAAAAIATSHFTLSWMHSVEKVRWTEHWRVTPAGLVVDEASIEGSGAGMDPPDDAVFRDGAWHYRPRVPPQPAVTLAASRFTPPHTLCARGRCRPLGRWVPGPGPVTLSVCGIPSPAR